MSKQQLRIVASIEARMNSQRLPGKVMADICGQPALTRLVNRLKKCRQLDDIVLATTSNSSDDVLLQWAQQENVKVYRGSEEDVLARVLEAQKMMQSDVIVEITGDCTLLDPEIIDLGIETFLHNQCDLVTNVSPATFPMGIDVQVYLLKSLEWVEKNIHDPAAREHVSLYFYEHPETYKIHRLIAPYRWFGPTYRFQLDYPEDYQFINEVYRKLEPTYGENFGIEEMMQLLKQTPDLVKINQHCIEKSAR